MPKIFPLAVLNFVEAAVEKFDYAHTPFGLARVEVLHTH